MTGTELQRTTPRENSGTHETKPRGTGVIFTPRVDIVETDSELFLYADLPGVRPGDISLNRKGNELVLHARCGWRSHGAKAIHMEYGVGDYYRTFAIADEMDSDKIDATLENGVLTVRVPKTEKVRPKRIAVKGG